jgi:antitoxin ParD1/3/4
MKKKLSKEIRTDLPIIKIDAKVIDLKKAIEEGLASGVVENFDPNMHLKMLKAAKRIGK